MHPHLTSGPKVSEESREVDINFSECGGCVLIRPVLYEMSEEGIEVDINHPVWGCVLVRLVIYQVSEEDR